MEDQKQESAIDTEKLANILLLSLEVDMVLGIDIVLG